MNDRLEYRRLLGLPKADETDLVSMLRANANEPCMTIGGRAWALEAANEIETALAAIAALEALKEVYRSRWLSCVTPEEAQRLRDEAEAAKHTAIAYAKREVQDMETMRTVRSLLRGLPASKTAVQIDEILASAMAAAGGDVAVLTL